MSPDGSKSELIRRAIGGVQELQSKSSLELENWHKTQQRLVPPHVPLPSGELCLITEDGLEALHDYGMRWREEDAERTKRVDAAGAAQLSARVFGEMLAGEALKEMDPTTDARRAFEQLLAASLDALCQEIEFSFPCCLFDDEAVPSFLVGPVRFQRRSEWLNCVISRAKPITPSWVDDVESLWDGRCMDPPAHDPTAKAVCEDFSSKWVAVVTVTGYTRKAADAAAKVAVRIALDTLGLPLGAPLAQNLRGPGDALRAQRERTFMQGQGRDITYSTSFDIPRIALRPGDCAQFMLDTNRLRLAAGKAVRTLLELKPSSSTPNLLRRWAEAMHWFGAARRESVPAIALVKFGVSLDVLARGMRSSGILKLCSNLFDMNDTDRATSDGTNLKQLINAIYNDGRSQIAHGGNLFLLGNVPVEKSVADYTVSSALDLYIRFLDVYSGTDDYEAFVRTIPTLRSLL